MKKTVLFIGLFLSFYSFSQEQFEWSEKSKFQIDSTDVWAVDILGNTYVTKKEVIQKFDSTGNFKFSQSQKSMGRLSSIQSINTMKFVIFSEEQQMMCFLDNTLTPYETCVGFEDEGINNATNIATSSQPNKFWVYDQLNSRLHLLALSQRNQSQEIENLKGLLNSLQVSFMMEFDNLLYILDSNQGVFVFDMYGSLINFIKRSKCIGIQVDNNSYYLIENDYLVIINRENGAEIKIKCPFEGVIDFKKNGGNYFFRTKKEIKKYHLLFTK